MGLLGDRLSDEISALRRVLRFPCRGCFERSQPLGDSVETPLAENKTFTQAVS